MPLLQRVRLFAPAARPSVQVAFTCTILAGLAGLEWAGRSATSDIHDATAALGLYGLALVTAAWHKRRPLAWAGWLVERGRHIRRRAGLWKFQHGIDFRGDPPYPRRMPLGAWGFGVALMVWGVAALGVWYLLPGGWRDLGQRSSYVLYLVLLSAVVMSLAAGAAAGIALPIMLVDRHLRTVTSDSDRRTLDSLTGMGYFLTVVVAAAFLPIIGGLMACAVAAIIAAAACLQRVPGAVALLWRAGPGGPVYAVPVPRMVAGSLLFLVLVFADLILTGSNGYVLTKTETGAMPLTGFLAGMLAWTAPGLLIMVAALIWRIRRDNPAAQVPPTLFLRTALSAARREEAAAIMRSWGWNIRDADEAVEPGDVKIELVKPDQSQATEFEPRWPLPVSLDDLRSGIVRERLQRRDEIQLRRRFFAGMRSLFKQARAEGRPRGGGYWFAPHWWFVVAMGRDSGKRGRREAAGARRQAGPLFAKAFGVRPRQHWHRVLRAVRIDLVFVEDGVSAKSVERVMRMMLELYDMHAGRRFADDHTFRGIPKVRVVVHDIDPKQEDSAWELPYKQPKYDELSRGRVLHIFKDQGESEEVADRPFDWDFAPSPLVGV